MKLLCADIGTSSLKAAVIDETGKVWAKAKKDFLLYTTVHSSKEWLPALQNCIHGICSENQDLKIDGLVISGNGPTLVTVTGETMLWNEEVAQGNSKSLFIPRIVQFKKNLGEQWDKSKWIFSGPEYLIYLLTDSPCTILPEERYFDAYWTHSTLVEAGLTLEDCNKFPQFVKPGSKAGVLTHKAVAFLGAEANGIIEGIPVFCGAPDFISALVGTGTIKAGCLCDRAGSSEGLNFCTDIALKGDGIRTLPSVVSGLWNASTLLCDTGTRFGAYKQKTEREMGLSLTSEEFVKLILENDGTNPSLDQGKYFMIQTALDVKTCIETLRKQANAEGIPFPAEMTITGGQSNNVLWNQMKADITGMTIKVCECRDAELLGDAIFAFAGMGTYDSIESACNAMCRISKIFVPNSND